MGSQHIVWEALVKTVTTETKTCLKLWDKNFQKSKTMTETWKFETQIFLKLLKMSSALLSCLFVKSIAFLLPILFFLFLQVQQVKIQKLC